MRSSVAVDFDGVLHSYTSGWQGEGTAPDPPVPGAIPWLNAITATHDVAINSARCATAAGRTCIYNWLLQHGASSETMDRVTIPEHKPKSVLYLDDRGWRFDGTNFPTADEVDAAEPWWKT